MKFFSPWALWFLALIPLVILMYILKQKFEEKEISSTQLWMQVLKDIDVNTPWQRLKKNILLFLQLLFILLLILALADPSIFFKGSLHSNLIVVIDNTGSMSAVENGAARLDRAKRMAESEIRNSGANTEITIVSSGRYPKVEIARTTDKNAAVSKLREIVSSKSAGSINASVSLIEALSKQYESARTIFYTDSIVNIKGLNADVISLADKSQNVSLDYISYSKSENGIKTMVRVTNRGTEAVTREVSLYAGEKLLDITSTELQPQSTAVIYFDEYNADESSVWAELSEADGLVDDNVIYSVVKPSEVQKVLLVSSQNVFLEKALQSISSIELYKTNPDEAATDDYDLYIFDGNLPNELPQKGSILLINPPAGNKVIKTQEDVQGGIADIEVHPITKYMENAYFVISSLKNIEAPYWTATLIQTGDYPAALAGEYNGRRIAVIAFDLHNSDFALTTEYPIFVHNLMEYLINIAASGNTSYFCGEPVQINPAADAKSAYIVSPSGEKFEVELKYPVLPFEHTFEQGIYRLVQAADGKNHDSLFAVNFPVESESNIYLEADSTEGNYTDDAGMQAGRRVQTALIILILMLAATEWVVYTRGY